MVDEGIDVNMLRRVKLQSALRKFAITVAGRSIDYKIVVHRHERPYGEPPAWSDANTINVWHDIETPIMEVDSVVRLKGLTIHELGHVLFTPRDRTTLVKDVMQHHAWQAFNILEDNRIDNMMVARLSGVAPWLLHTVLAEFFSTPDGHEHLMPLLHGRKYVPQKIRDLAASVYHNQEHVPDIQRIIDEYIKLNLARKESHKRALELVLELRQLLSKEDLTQHDGHETCSPAKNGGEDMAGIREQDDALQRAEKQQQQQASESDDDADAEPANASSGSDKQELDQQIRQAQSNVSTEIYEDIKDMVKGMRDGSGHSGSHGADKSVTMSKGVYMTEVDPDMRLNTRHFARVLQELKAMHDPAWVSNSSEGRLNARQFLMGADLDQSFDLWDDGQQDASDIECVVLLDISGSMYHMLGQAYDAMWGIKRALDSINASTTVVTFGDYSRVLYTADSRATVQRKHSMDGYGSTNPLQGLKYARDTFYNSSRAIKLLVVITDGYWFDKQESDAAIAEMRMAGVVTGLVHLIDNYTEEMSEAGRDVNIDTHGCDVVKTLTNPHDITDFAKQLVQRQQRMVLNS
jgi:hypothetical protein